MASPNPNTRDEFTEATKQLLARRAGFRCSICLDITVGPHSDPDKTVYLGEASHIYSAATSGPRANPSLSREERTSASNGIHLCKTHAKLIDVDVKTYTAERLKEIKTAHEQQIRAMIIGPAVDYDPDFLKSHQTQVVHGRGSTTLNDLWVSRRVVQLQVGQMPTKSDPISLLSSESGVLLVVGDQWTGRTSLLKRMAAEVQDKGNCVWLDGRNITERMLKDPVHCLAAGYQKLNADPDGWHRFLEAAPTENFIFIDDLHLSTLNVASKRKFLGILQTFSHLITATVNDPFLLELLAVSSNDGLRLNAWQLLDLARAECAHLVDKWCRFGAESVPDHELDNRIASAQSDLEVLFGRKMMPRQPLFVLTALQGMDAGSPVDTAVGSFGGVYETVIHFALSKNAPNQAAITSERAYLEELAYWCEGQPVFQDRQAFNKWFAERKGVHFARVAEIEKSLLAKGFVARNHQGFKFNYQKYYFLASFIRDNPNRPGVKDYVSKLISECWNEDYANTALFLAYLQPSSFLVQALLAETTRLFCDRPEFSFTGWKIDVQFPKGFFRGLTLSNDPESNRRALAERLDEASPIDSPTCSGPVPDMTKKEDDKQFLDFLKSFHLIKMIGQLIRNSPIAFDAEQKTELVMAGFNLSFRIVTFLGEVCSVASLQSQALNELREKVLKTSNREELEVKLAKVLYNLSIFFVFLAIRHACFYLAHKDLTLIYQRLLRLENSKPEDLSLNVLACGLFFELRSPDPDLLRKVYKDLTPAGQDFLQMWSWLFLSFNRVSVAKKQAILESVDMAANTQLLLPKA
jgi:hypothetical protein